ncbi:MAG: MraY family glycosyltransferase [Patescibacteria group bacterium]|nr:MraY family glycosyltransferase [Patescibacteria group bacterium]
MDQIGLLVICGYILAGTALLSFILSYFSRRWAIRFKALDIPKSPRKIHKEPVPLWGGLGIGLTLITAVFVFGSDVTFLSSKISLWQIIGFILGIIILCIGGMLDDKYDLKAWQSLIFPILAALAVVLTGTSIVHVTNPGTSAAFFLNWWVWHPFGSAWSLSLPSDLLTFIWILVAIFATKITDGLDGLVSGITVIGAAMVGLLSVMKTYFQPESAILAASVGGAYLGFLPKNMHPAKQFLGEGGATIAGFCLGFLAILSSAKIAIALAVLAIPVADVAFVFMRRIYNHKPWYQGDDTHLHFRLLAAGLPHRTIVFLLWIISASAGIMALTFQTRGKIFLIIALVLLTFLVSWLADKAIKRRQSNQQQP